MNASAGGQCQREKSRTAKPKAISDDPASAASSIPNSNLQTTSTAPIKADLIVDDSSTSIVDGKGAPKYALDFLLHLLCPTFSLFMKVSCG